MDCLYRINTLNLYRLQKYVHMLCGYVTLSTTNQNHELDICSLKLVHRSHLKQYTTMMIWRAHIKCNICCLQAHSHTCLLLLRNDNFGTYFEMVLLRNMHQVATKITTLLGLRENNLVCSNTFKIQWFNGFLSYRTIMYWVHSLVKQTMYSMAAVFIQWQISQAGRGQYIFVGSFSLFNFKECLHFDLLWLPSLLQSHDNWLTVK